MSLDSRVHPTKNGGHVPPWRLPRLCARLIGVEPRAGTVVNGAIVLDDADGLVEGASVTVWIGEATDDVSVSDSELELIDRGQQAAARGELLDARAFLMELRREG